MPNFNNVSFEKNLQSFSKEIKQYQVENKIENIQQSHVRDFIKTRYNQPSVSRAQTQNQQNVLQESESLPDYLVNESDQLKKEVEDLIVLAFSKGIEASAKKAIAKGPFILDAFHDALTSKLYEELKNRGLLK